MFCQHLQMEDKIMETLLILDGFFEYLQNVKWIFLELRDSEKDICSLTSY